MEVPFYKYLGENWRIHFLSMAKQETTGQRSWFVRKKKILHKRLHHQEQQKHLQSLFKKANTRLSKQTSKEHLQEQLAWKRKKKKKKITPLEPALNWIPHLRMQRNISLISSAERFLRCQQMCNTQLQKKTQTNNP